jgi:hypothetical protein
MAIGSMSLPIVLERYVLLSYCLPATSSKGDKVGCTTSQSEGK